MNPTVLVDVHKAQGQPAGIGAYLRDLAIALSQVLPIEGLVFAGPRPSFPFPVRVLHPSVFVLSDIPATRRARALHVPLIGLGRVPALLAPELAVPIIFDLSPKLFPETHPTVRGFLERQTYRVATRAHWLITISETSRRDLVDHLGVDPDRICVVRPGRPAIDTDDGNDEACLHRFGITEPYLLAVGTLEPRKNLTVIVEALQQLEAEPGLQLVVAGTPGWKYGPLLAAMRPLEAAGRIRRVGYVTNAERSALYRRALCLVFPSLYEGFGLPILEAMTYGTPVLASTAPACVEVLGSAGMSLDPRDAGVWAAAIERVRSDSKWRRRLAAAGRERAKEFTWSRSIASLVNRLGALKMAA